ncbi:SCO3242 family prenyltransferase [Granulicoccus sp. GXG6511]|uniref:SCO3242 family prenyltransferase n=1 Tax=Granulicoccus sp. GXG6511 TaxID=3381351 RepID=UPI003D7D33D5
MTDRTAPASGAEKARVVAELLRAPAAFSAIGDPLVGAFSGGPVNGRQLMLPLTSVLIYAGGMGLNDWADREIDAEERPERPIPSGRLTAGEAFRISTGLIGAGVLVAGLLNGPRGFGRAAVLAATVAAYDTVAKDTPAGAWVMAACRSLNVLLGAGSLRAAVAPALTVGAHTVAVTELSKAEVHGSDPTLPAGVRIAVGAVAAVTPVTGRWSDRPVLNVLGRAGAAVSAYRYLTKTIPPLNRAVAEPTGARIRDAVRSNLGALIPLQAALIARTGNVVPALAVAALEPAQKQVIRRLRGDTT